MSLHIPFSTCPLLPSVLPFPILFSPWPPYPSPLRSALPPPQYSLLSLCPSNHSPSSLPLLIHFSTVPFLHSVRSLISWKVPALYPYSFSLSCNQLFRLLILPLISLHLFRRVISPSFIHSFVSSAPPSSQEPYPHSVLPLILHQSILSYALPSISLTSPQPFLQSVLPHISSFLP
jgi:hypothetical protein